MADPPRRVVVPKRGSSAGRPRSAGGGMKARLEVIQPGTPSMVISGAADKTEALKKYSTYQKAGLPPPGMGSRPATGSPITSKGKPRVLSGVAAPKSGRAGAKVTETVPVAAEARAPIELQGQFLACVMAKQFVEAEMLCRKILTVEPTNPTVLEFLPVLREKLELDAIAAIEDDDDEDPDDSDGDDEDDEDEGVDSGGDGPSVDEPGTGATIVAPCQSGALAPDTAVDGDEDESESDDDDDEPDRTAGYVASGVLMRPPADSRAIKAQLFQMPVAVSSRK